jgi:hypothetical protein
VPRQEQQKAKGNPASHRMSNPHRKEKWPRAHRNSERTKAARRKVAEIAQRGNEILRKAGELTPWEKAKAERSKRRRPLQEAYEKRAQGAS